ncbi:MAG TPA: hypothetical protein VK598_04755 [Nitrospiraceae bacterium]|nr:hypothetical protein [Nitrospiraceae bacterium]
MLKVSITGKRVQMENGKLTVSFNLNPEPGPLVAAGTRPWYAGSAPSIRYRDDKSRDIEMLDLFRHILKFDWAGHDDEKRCFQIERLTLFDSQLGTEGEAQVNIFDREYSHVSIACGETECSLFVQCPIVLLIPALGTGHQSVPQYYLNRKLTLKKLTSHVFEDISVNRADADGKPLDPLQEVDFSAAFFGNLDLGLVPLRAKDLTNGWLSIAFTGENPYAPRFAYGFACSRGTAISRFDTPVPGYAHPSSGSHRTFAWQTARRRGLQAVHLLTFGNETDIDGSLIRQLQP